MIQREIYLSYCWKKKLKATISPRWQRLCFTRLIFFHRKDFSKNLSSLWLEVGPAGDCDQLQLSREMEAYHGGTNRPEHQHSEKLSPSPAFQAWTPTFRQFLLYHFLVLEHFSSMNTKIVFWLHSNFSLFFCLLEHLHCISGA